MTTGLPRGSSWGSAAEGCSAEVGPQRVPRDHASRARRHQEINEAGLSVQFWRGWYTFREATVMIVITVMIVMIVNLLRNATDLQDLQDLQCDLQCSI